MEKKLSLKIKNMNIILTLMIVSLHSTFCWSVDYTSGFGYVQKEIMRYINTLTTVTVAGFFVISAFLTFFNFNNIKNDYLALLEKRFKSVFIPYILWGILSFVYYFVAIHCTNFFDSKTFPNNVLDFLKFIWFSEGNPPLWYLRVLIEFFMLSPLFYIAVKKTGSKSWILSFAFLVINMIILPPYSSIIYWFPSLFFGAYVAIYKPKKVIGKRYQCVTKSLAVGLYIILGTGIYFINDEYSPIFYCWRFVSVILFWVMIDGMDYQFSPVMKTNHTFFIFCSHYILIEAIRGILFQALGIKEWSILLIYVLTFSTTLLISQLLAIILERLFPKISAILNGGR